MNYKKISLLLLCFCYFAFAPQVHAQYGNEWIVPSQKYYKIEIGENHVYKIDHASLLAAGLPVGSINPKNFQLYRAGEEQYIYVQGQNDDIFNPGDFIEFYGERNDGKLDAPLYLTPEQQPHQYMSLYQDTINYYLTWSTTTPGKRYTDFYNGNYAGNTTDPWLWHESVMYFGDGVQDQFYDGSPYSSPGSFSEYTEGEGWFGPYIATSRDPIFEVNTEHYNTTGPQPKLSFAVYGKSNPEQSVNGQNHRIEVNVGSTFLYGRTHFGYTRIETGLNAPKLDIPTNLIGATTPVRFESTFLARARHAVSYIKIEYPRDLNLAGKSFFEFDYTANNSYFEFTNFTGSSATIFDIENKRRIKGDVSGTTLQFNTSATGQKKVAVVADNAIKNVSSIAIKEVEFENSDYTTTDYDYIIVTHPKLEAGAQEYKTYRESDEGGNYKVLIAYMPDIYEKYYYGVKHPMALRNFCRDIYTSQPNKPKHILLLGKGQSYFLTRFNYIRREFENLVPTWGEPGSDYPFVTDYTPNDLAPVMGIGRIPARSNADIRTYLYKLKLHEQYLNNAKKVLFLTGGFGIAEQRTLQSKQAQYYSTLRGVKFGAEGVFIEKKEAEPIDASLVEVIQNEINEGVSAISYFGHGASQILEVDIGKPNQLDNEGKYPLFVFNGCALGNTYSDISLPEEFLFEEKTGGVAWIASSAFGFIDPLAKWTNAFYKNLYNTHYGSTIGEVIAITTDQYQNPTDNFNRSQCRQMTYHGDPAITLYAPDKPDFQIDPNITEYPENANAEMDSFALNINLKNFGRAEDREPQVFVSVKYSNDSIRTFGPRSFGPVYNTLPIKFWLPINEFSVGFQTATIYIDYGDSIEELAPLGETNNTLSYLINLPSNRLSVLAPKKDDIQPKAEVTLMVQNNNLLVKDNRVIFQIDTTPLFNSPVLQVSEEIASDNIIQHNFVLPPFDSTDFFWRAIFAKDISDPKKWVQSTFSLIFQSPSGWSQGYFSKLGEGKTEALGIDLERKELTFKRRVSGRYDITAGGMGATWFQTNIIDDNKKAQGRYSRNQVELMAVNPDNLDRYSEENNVYNLTNRGRDVIAGFRYYVEGEKSGVYFYDTKNPVQMDSMHNLLNRIPEGWHLFFLINGDVGYENWPDSIFTAIEQFGAANIRTLNVGDPYGLMGFKGDEIGDAIELLANYESTVEPRNQQIPGSRQFFPLLTQGTLTTQNIGPSQQWKQFYKIPGIKDTEADTVTYSILGVDAEGSDTLLMSNISAKTADLSSIDATTYPFLKIRAFFKDEDKRTPASQERWTVLYDGVPEGSLMPDLVFEQTHDTIQEGDSIGFTIAYKNISNFDMDSVLVVASNLLSNNTKDTIELKKYPPLAPGDSMVLRYKIHTLGLIAKNDFVISVNPNFNQPEQTLENNIISLQYVVERDNKNPLLDVVFDGIHILDYDIVSPSPVITMSVLDDNSFILINDPSSFVASITHLDEVGNPTSQIDSIVHTQANTNFYPANAPGEKAMLEYIPEGLESGQYRLDVAVRDASGNTSSDLNYSINFEVIKESQITNVYPYPNPFTTSMKFVYTLTGEQVPDYMKIQILTVTGKVVREITQNEIGPIRIGNNISEFTWNGTDEFGDQLANGVYLYKVTARINGEDIQQRETAGDKFFNKGYGKIYLMR